jgi:hypothetical protein
MGERKEAATVWRKNPKNWLDLGVFIPVRVFSVAPMGA